MTTGTENILPRPGEVGRVPDDHELPGVLEEGTQLDLGARVT